MNQDRYYEFYFINEDPDYLSVQTSLMMERELDDSYNEW